MRFLSIMAMSNRYMRFSLIILMVCNFVFLFSKLNSFFYLSVFPSTTSQESYSANRKMPLIFIGGSPRSGTTLMRSLLDAHPEIRCGQETRVIRRILYTVQQWLTDEPEKIHLANAGISKQVIDNAVAAFFSEVIIRHGESAPRLCNKDATILKMGTYILELFPNAKFLFMVRDGRAMVHSAISRQIPFRGFVLSSYRKSLAKWNEWVLPMNNECEKMGKKCFKVYYEQLVLHPREWMKKILDFLGVPWDESVLHHQDFINKPGGIALSKTEQSSDQIIKPIYYDSLTKWVGNIPDDVLKDMAEIAPMLSILGYDPYDNSPFYGVPDRTVYENTRKILEHGDFWREKARNLSIHNVSFFLTSEQR